MNQSLNIPKSESQVLALYQVIDLQIESGEESDLKSVELLPEGSCYEIKISGKPPR